MAAPALPAPTLLDRVERALDEYRAPVFEELHRIVPAESPLRDALYEPIRRYALRPGKGLRPAICLATCRALGGSFEAALPTASVLELFHNAFLIHDDVEDGSQQRRGGPAFSNLYGAAAAINAGDAMLALALRPLLDNTQTVGLGKALRVLEEIAAMARETAEGQAIELDWIQRGISSPSEREYVDLVERKTASYSFVAPVTLGAIIAGATDDCLACLRRFARALGVAFQIRDDVLALEPGNHRWGKDEVDDLWEGKRTLVLSHAMASASDEARQKARAILDRRRPTAEHALLLERFDELQRSGELSVSGRARLDDELRVRSKADVDFLLSLIEDAGSLRHASDVAERFAVEASDAIGAATAWLAPSTHLDFLHDLIAYVRARDR